MVVKNQIKFIKNLQQKKCRIEQGLFVVEGVKIVQELLASEYKVYKIYCTDSNVFDVVAGSEVVSQSVLKQMSGLKNPNNVLGVFYVPRPKKVDFDDWVVVLDDVRDPGNLGTIIRLCDWFGIGQLVCSNNTVDCYNPKVLQASMGSITRVNLVYTNTADFLKKSNMPVYGAFMDGHSVYSAKLPEIGILVLGNEANGISKEVEALVTERVAIPQFGSQTTESLNVATATAILLSELRRR